MKVTTITLLLLISTQLNALSPVKNNDLKQYFEYLKRRDQSDFNRKNCEIPLNDYYLGKKRKEFQILTF